MKRLLVIKYGGNAMVDTALMAAVARDVTELSAAGNRVVMAHGGGPEIEKMLCVLGIESRFVHGLRATDERTMEVVQMVLCGKVNKNIAALIGRSGGTALGLCGLDGGLLRAERDTRHDLGLVGNIRSVNVPLLETLLDAGIIPVLSPVAVSPEGGSLNVNADTAAAMTAAALHADELVLLTDICGILRDLNDPNSRIEELTAKELYALKDSGTLSGGMIPKADGCLAALKAGVRTVRIVDGRIPHVLRSIFGEEHGQGGTLIRQ
jgi:acetylglutamate kinase